jgi:2-dehydropantoate 2-reductase
VSLRVAIVGAGAVGCTLGAFLLREGARVSFVARGATLEALRARGIAIENGPDAVTFEHVEATDDPATIGRVDIVILGVKAWQLEEALRVAAPLVGAATMIMVPQNGIAPPLEVARLVGRDRTIVALVRISVIAREPGRVHHAGGQVIEIGTLADAADRSRLEELCRALGPRATIPENIVLEMWDKMIVMATMTAIGMAVRAPISIVVGNAELLDLAVRAAAEAVAVAAASGAPVRIEKYGRDRFERLGQGSTMMSSTQRDFILGRRSDLDAVVGGVPHVGREVGVATPIFDMLYALLLPQELRARGALSYE